MDYPVIESWMNLSKGWSPLPILRLRSDIFMERQIPSVPLIPYEGIEGLRLGDEEHRPHVIVERSIASKQTAPRMISCVTDETGHEILFQIIGRKRSNAMVMIHDNQRPFVV